MGLSQSSTSATATTVQPNYLNAIESWIKHLLKALLPQQQLEQLYPKNWKITEDASFYHVEPETPILIIKNYGLLNISIKILRFRLQKPNYEVVATAMLEDLFLVELKREVVVPLNYSNCGAVVIKPEAAASSKPEETLEKKPQLVSTIQVTGDTVYYQDGKFFIELKQASNIVQYLEGLPGIHQHIDLEFMKEMQISSGSCVLQVEMPFLVPTTEKYNNTLFATRCVATLKDCDAPWDRLHVKQMEYIITGKTNACNITTSTGYLTSMHEDRGAMLVETNTPFVGLVPVFSDVIDGFPQYLHSMRGTITSRYSHLGSMRVGCPKSVMFKPVAGTSTSFKCMHFDAVRFDENNRGSFIIFYQGESQTFSITIGSALIQFYGSIQMHKGFPRYERHMIDPLNTSLASSVEPKCMTVDQLIQCMQIRIIPVVAPTSSPSSSAAEEAAVMKHFLSQGIDIMVSKFDKTATVRFNLKTLSITIECPFPKHKSQLGDPKMLLSYSIVSKEISLSWTERYKAVMMLEASLGFQLWTLMQQQQQREGNCRFADTVLYF